MTQSHTSGTGGPLCVPVLKSKIIVTVGFQFVEIVNGDHSD